MFSSSIAMSIVHRLHLHFWKGVFDCHFYLPLRFKIVRSSIKIPHCVVKFGWCLGKTFSCFQLLFFFSFYLIRVLNRYRQGICRASSLIRIHTFWKGYNNNNNNNNNKDRQFKENNTQNEVTRYTYLLIKQWGSRSGTALCRAWFGSKLLKKVIEIRHSHATKAGFLVSMPIYFTRIYLLHS